MQSFIEDPDWLLVMEASDSKIDELLPLFISIKNNIKEWETIFSAFYD